MFTVCQGPNVLCFCASIQVFWQESNCASIQYFVAYEAAVITLLRMWTCHHFGLKNIYLTFSLLLVKKCTCWWFSSWCVLCKMLGSYLWVSLQAEDAQDLCPSCLCVEHLTDGPASSFWRILCFFASMNTLYFYFKCLTSLLLFKSHNINVTPLIALDTFWGCNRFGGSSGNFWKKENQSQVVCFWPVVVISVRYHFVKLCGDVLRTASSVSQGSAQLVTTISIEQ